MVHRPSDSRLLTNLLAQEKDYSKHLNSLLDASSPSLASFSAYASASSPPTSHVILAVARSLAGADDALRRYASAVEEWRSHLKDLRDLEDDVANVMRDREILVTRLIKASKSHKPPKERDGARDSIGLQPHQFPSSSDLSLRSDFTGPRSDFSGLPAIPTSAKLTAAQAELQACEAHLAAKERELAARRSSAVKEGLSVRCRAMVECGWVWGEMGREALRVLEDMEDGTGTPQQPSHPHTRPTSIQYTKPLPDPHPSSELSSLAPSQSASQINLPFVSAPTGPNSILAPGGETTINGDGTRAGNGNSGNKGAYTHPQINIPPAHAISDYTGQVYESGGSSVGHGAYEGAVNGADVPRRHVLARRITEEELAAHQKGSVGISLDHHERGEARRRDSGQQDRQFGSGYQQQAQQLKNPREEEEEELGGSSAEEEAEQREVQIIENPRFASKAASASKTSFTGDRVGTNSTGAGGKKGGGAISGIGRRLGIGGHHGHDQATPTAPPAPSPYSPGVYQKQNSSLLNTTSTPTPPRNRRSMSVSGGSPAHGQSGGSGSGFFGSIRLRGIFGGHHRREGSVDSLPAVHSTGGAGWRKGKSKWETRTEKNLRDLGKGSDDEGVVGVGGNGEARRQESTPTPTSAPPPKLGQRRSRVVSEAGVGMMGAATAAPRRLRKGRAGEKAEGKKEARKPRSSSVPPVSSAAEQGELGENQAERAEAWVGEQAQGNKQDKLEPTQEQKREDGQEGTGAGGVTITPVRKRSIKGKGKPPGQPASASGGSGTATPMPSTPATASTPTPAHIAALSTTPTSTLTQPTKSNTNLSNLGGLSRNSSITSAMSAPPTTRAGHGRSASLGGAGSGFTAHPVGRGGAVGGGANGGSLGRKTGVGRRASVPVAVPPVPSSGAGTTGASLMSIVEDVARGREANAGAGPGIGVGMGEVVRAPAKVGRKELEELERGRPGVGMGGTKNVDVPVFEIPRAPGSVFDVAAPGGMSSSTSTVQQSPTMTSSPAPTSTGMLEAPKQARRPAVSPLRSALRNSSRTPSPLPAQVSASTSAPIAAVATTSTSSLARTDTGSGAKRPASRSPPVSNLGNGTDSTSHVVPGPPTLAEAPVGGNDRTTDVTFPKNGPEDETATHMKAAMDKGKAKETVVDEESSDEDDGASISSYETGLEVLYPGDDNEEQVSKSAHGQSSQHEIEDDRTKPVSVPNGSASHGPQAQSDISTSTVSGEAQRAAAPSASESEPARRRKSVRVSLQPTFSPTPPAIEDGDEGYEAHVPWGRGVGVDKGKGKGKTGTSTGGSTGVAKVADVADVVDMWQDSSEEDAEYSRAKRLLSRVGRKEKKKKAAV